MQSKLVMFLRTQGFKILSAANTATKEAGVDVIAVDADGDEWWITVKGFPERKPEKATNPATQGRHWFSHAMFDVVVYRTQMPDVRIGVALPSGFTTYSGLGHKVRWLHESAPFTYFWVDEGGTVQMESAGFEE